MPNSTNRNLLIGAVAVLVIIASVVFLLWHHGEGGRLDTRLHRTLGMVLAEETAKLVAGSTNKTRICVIALKPKESPAIKLQLDAFAHAVTNLTRAKIKATEYVDSSTSDKYGPGGGLSARRYARVMHNNTNSDVFVSFIGVPEWDKTEFSHWSNGFPPLVAETRDRKRVKKLFEKGLLKTAIVPRFTYPAEKSSDGNEDRDHFLRRHQVVTVEDAANMPTE